MGRVNEIRTRGISAARSAEELARADRAHLSRADQVQAEVRSRAGDISRVERAGLPGDLLTTTSAGAGMGFVFGPLGALLGAGLAHLFNRGRKSAIEQYAAQDATATTKALNQGRKALVSQLGDATNDQERAEIEAMISEFDQNAELTRHPDPSVRASALANALNVSGGLDSWLDDVQSERIAAEKVRREESSAQFADFDEQRTRLVAESTNFIRAREAWQGAQALVENPSPTNDISLIYKMANINDPGAIVTEGDVQVLQSSGGITEQMSQFYNSVIRGEAALSGPQRDDLINTIDTLYREQRNGQIERNAQFQEIGEARGFMPEYQELLKVPIDPAEAGVLARSKPGGPTPPDPNSDLVPQDGLFEQVAGGVAGGFQEKMSEAGAALRGNSVQVDANTLARYEVDPDGQIVRELTPLGEWVNPDGDTLRRVTDPGGNVSVINASQISEAERRGRLRNRARTARERGGSLRPVNE